MVTEVYQKDAEGEVHLVGVKLHDEPRRESPEPGPPNSIARAMAREWLLVYDAADPRGGGDNYVESLAEVLMISWELGNALGRNQGAHSLIKTSLSSGTHQGGSGGSSPVAGSTPAPSTDSGSGEP